MDYGARRAKITLHAKNISISEGGRASSIYPEIASVWASATDISRALDDIGGKSEMPLRVTFTAHFSHLYLKARRISWDGRFFRVTAITEPDLKRRSLAFAAEEIFR